MNEMMDIKKKRQLLRPELEIDRLVMNSKALLDVLPSMVFLVSEDREIQYLNKFAMKIFGNLHGKLCTDYLCNYGNNCNERCPLVLAEKGDKCAEPVEIRTVKMDVEYYYAPFLGYEGHHLTMLLMTNITERNDRIREIERYNKNIADVLKEKIIELHASENLRNQLLQEVNVLKEHIQHSEHDDGIIGTSKKMRDVRDLVNQVAPTDSIVLVTGESGTGKELIADLIYKKSNRSKAPFLKFNCSSINESLLESELFGYEKGAFTGAQQRQKGKFETVDGGTIFLDEIGDISKRMQASLLRVLQSGELIRVGGSKPVKVDVRIIAATNKDLAEAVEKGEFRLDLWYRLNVLNIILPPLRDRKEDIIDLAIHFIQFYRDSFKKRINFVPNNVIDKLLKHSWSGNVRELENVLHRAVLVSKSEMLTEDDIVFDGYNNIDIEQDYLDKLHDHLEYNSLKDSLASVEKDLIEYTLQRTGGDAGEARKLLQVGKTAFYAKIKKYNINLL